MAYKVFTNGSTLQASELNENLMQQSVAVFSNAAARTAAITSPVEGQLTYLEDTNQYASWNGSAWVSPFGSTLLATSTFTSQTSVALDNIFSSDYRFYDYYFAASASSAAQFSIRLRSGSSDLSSSTYAIQRFRAEAGTLAGERDSGQTAWVAGTLRTNIGFWSGAISNPFLASRTQFTMVGADDTNPVRMETCSAVNTEGSSYNGIRFFAANAMTGNLSIYGRRA